MSIEVDGSGGLGGATSPIRELTKFGHTRAKPNLALSAEILYPAAGFPIGAGAFAFFGAGVTRSFLAADQRRVWNLQPAVAFGVGAGMVWKNSSTGGTLQEQTVDFRESALSVEAFGPFGQAYATVVQAWLRKFDNVSPTTARQRFGFMSGGTSPFGQSSRVPHVGILGDGNVGFRLGSVNCPDGGGGGDNAFGDVDPGFVQPVVLQNPGLQWFHVRVKMIPATPSTPPIVGIYLDGSLRVAFFTPANFPRGFNTVNQGYQQVEAACVAGSDAGTQLNGWEVADWEQWYDTDLSL